MQIISERTKTNQFSLVDRKRKGEKNNASEQKYDIILLKGVGSVASR